MMQLVGWVTTLLAIAGVLLNNRLDRRCFILWMVSNAASCVLHIIFGLAPLAVRDAVFFVLAIEGFIRWKRPTTAGSTQTEGSHG